MKPAVTPDILNAATNIARWRAAPPLMVRDLFSTTPDAWQDEALAAFPKSPRMALKACAGPGKGFRLSMRFDTPNGEMTWGDLKEGSSVFAPDGSICSVKRTFLLGTQVIYRVRFDDGTFCDVTGEHLWKVRGRTERRHWKARQQPDWTPERERRAAAQGHPQTPPDGYSVLTTLEIIERNESSDGRRNQFEIPIQGQAQFPHAQQPLDPYLIGVWLGDGHRSEPSYMKPYREVEREIQRRGYQTSRNAEDCVRILKSVALFREALGPIFECGSPSRSIPRIYKYASVQQRTDLICGLMDTDGTIGQDGHMEYATTSETLANDVVWLVRSLGGVALIKAAIKEGWYYADGKRVACLDCYRVTVTLPFNPFRIAHKCERWHLPQRRYLTRYIIGIEMVGRDQAMCIEVDHPSACHLANDFIVTHNTTVLAWIGLNFLLTRSHPMVGAASISGDNLRANLWPELARWRQKSPLLTAAFELTDKAIFSREHPRTWRMEARTWAKDANADQIGVALAGLHAKNVMWLLDETGGFPESVMPVIESIFAGEPEEAHVVQAGNPIQRSGPLYRACHAARNLWKVIEITGDPDDPRRSPRISIEYARAQIAQYGRDNPWVQARILGQFPPASLSSLIGEEEMMAATRRSYQDHDIANAARIMGVDVARFGDDQSVCFPRQGLVAFTPLTWRNIDGNVGAGAIARKWEEWNADACFVDDTGGFGASWIDGLRRLNRSPIGVHFSGEVHDKRYFNKRTEMWFDTVQWIRAGGQLPYVPELVAAMTTATYTFKGDRLLLQPKEQIKDLLGYSPDHADALALTFAEPVLRASRHHSSGSTPRNHTYDYDPYAEVNKPTNPAYTGR